MRTIGLPLGPAAPKEETGERQTSAPQPKLRWYQYRLRTLLLAQLGVALALGMFKWLGPIVFPCALALLGGLIDYFLCQAGGGRHKYKGAMGGGLGGVVGCGFYQCFSPPSGTFQAADLGELWAVLGLAAALLVDAIYRNAKKKAGERAVTDTPEPRQE